MKSSFIHRVLSSIRFRVRDWHIRHARQSWLTDTGIRINLKNHTDWIIFNEVFANGEYDPAIQRLLKGRSDDLKVLDLGANVGFFALRLAHLARSLEYAGQISIFSVEATPDIYKQLVANISALSLNTVKIVPYHGLAGLRSGTGVIYLYAMHVLNSVMRKTGKTAHVRYIDLGGLTEDWQSIDLLKCDIEGSELAFIQTYPDLLKKIKAAVIEFHYEMCDHEDCVRLLNESGLVHREVLKQHQYSSVEYFFR